MAGGVNVYGYCGSSPLANSDQSGFGLIGGRISSCILGVGGGLIGSIIGGGGLGSAFCSALASCVASAITSAIVAGCLVNPVCLPFAAIVGAIAGCLTSILANLYASLKCGDNLCGKDTIPNIFCIGLTSALACISGALGGFAGGLSDKYSEPKNSDSSLRWMPVPK